jgi:3-methyladenine DNA glycosylase AlkD
MTAPLARRVRDALRRVADPARAPMMQRYMKSSMPFLGVPAPVLRRACSSVYDDADFRSAVTWSAAALSVWRGARYREERYAAVHFTGDRRARPFQTMGALPIYEEMIATGAWWDIVDDIATHRLGYLLRLHPVPMKRLMRRWSRSRDLWKRRSAILCQMTFKRETDLDLLYACIEPSLASREFFLRKAIGWALRGYAWTDPREVVRYVRSRRRELSPLSKREALKNVLRSDGIREIP